MRTRQIKQQTGIIGAKGEEWQGRQLEQGMKRNERAGERIGQHDAPCANRVKLLACIESGGRVGLDANAHTSCANTPKAPGEFNIPLASD